MRQFDETMARQCRSQFPGLQRRQGDRPCVLFDGPAGTQVPQSVADAVSHYLLHTNANHGGLFATSLETDALVDEALSAMADFLGAQNPEGIVFGPNMTTLTMAFSRALSREWTADDEIIVSATDHDANIAPWLLAAEERGVTVHFVPFCPDTLLLDVDHLKTLLSPRTRLVTAGCASNATGGINPLREIVRLAHSVGAEVFLDAVHLSPHALIDVIAWDCDWLALSTYKFFGPHLGALWGRSGRWRDLRAFKVRPSSMQLPWKWMTGTQSFEAIAGGRACIEYIAAVGKELDRPESSLREAIKTAMHAISQYESGLAWKLIAGLRSIEGIRIYGITDPALAEHRVSTVSFTMEGISTSQLASDLAKEGIFVWGGNYYALEFSTRMGLEPEGMIRVGILHYHLAEEVDRLLAVLQEIRSKTLASAAG